MERVAPTPSKERTYKIINVVLLVLNLVSLALLVVGVATPGWSVRYSGYTSMRTNMGIWYIRYCPDLSPCRTVSIPKLDEDMDPDGMVKHNMMQYQVPSTIAIAACICGSVLLILVMTSRIARKSDTDVVKCFVFCVISMLALISGILTIQISAATGSLTKKFYDEYHDEDSSRPNLIHFPYSVLLVFLGSVASLFVWFIIVLTRPWRFSPVASYGVASSPWTVHQMTSIEGSKQHEVVATQHVPY